MSSFHLHVIFGQRREGYPGEYAPEALDVADEGCMEENPDWLHGRLEHHRKSNEFESVEIVKIAVPYEPIMQALRPANRPAISGTIVPK